MKREREQTVQVEVDLPIRSSISILFFPPLSPRLLDPLCSSIHLLLCILREVLDCQALQRGNFRSSLTAQESKRILGSTSFLFPSLSLSLPLSRIRSPPPYSVAALPTCLTTSPIMTSRRPKISIHVKAQLIDPAHDLWKCKEPECNEILTGTAVS